MIATRLTLGADQVEARRARARRSDRARGGRPRRRPLEIGPFRVEFVRMAHSIPDSSRSCSRRARGASCTRATGSSTTPPSTVSRPTSDARRDRQPRRRPPARRLDERRAPGDRPAPSGSSARPSGTIFPLRDRAGSSSPRSRRTSTACSRPPTSPSSVAARSPSSAARCGRTLNIARNLGYVEIPDDVIVNPDEADGAAARRGARALHGQPGRADVRADEDRVRQPSEHRGRPRRHGDHLRQAGPGERAAGARRDQPARAGRAPRCCTRRSLPSTSRVTRAQEEMRTLLSLLRPRR